MIHPPIEKTILLKKITVSCSTSSVCSMAVFLANESFSNFGFSVSSIRQTLSKADRLKGGFTISISILKIDRHLSIPDSP